MTSPEKVNKTDLLSYGEVNKVKESSHVDKPDETLTKISVKDINTTMVSNIAEIDKLHPVLEG